MRALDRIFRRRAVVQAIKKLASWTPASLFANNQPGVYFDPNNSATLFEDAAGTIPTALERPVGLMLDKRDTAYSTYFSGVGDYLTAPASSALNLTTGSWTIEGWFYGTSFPNLSNNILVKDGIAGSTYTQYTLRVTSGSKLIGEIGSGTSSNSFQTLTGITTVTANAWHHFAFTFDGSLLRLFLDGAQEISAAKTVTMGDGGAPLTIGAQNNNPSNYFNGYLSNLRIVKGTALYTANFTPPTAPLTAVVGTSLLTCGTTWSGNPAITTVGNARADKLNPFKTGTGNHATSSSTARPTLTRRVNQFVNSETLQTQSVTTRATTQTLRFEGTGAITLSGTATGVYTAGTYSVTTTAGTLTATVLGTVTRADLREANIGVGLPAYQRVGNTSVNAADYDTAGFPAWLRCSGGQSMVTPSINFTGTDKMTVWAGVRKLSDVNFGVIGETSTNAFSNGGAFNMVAGGSISLGQKYGLTGYGSSGYASEFQPFLAPISNVVSAIFDISQSTGSLEQVFRANAIKIAASNSIGTSMGAGNFGNYPLYLFARNQSSLFFNGLAGPIIVRGAQSSAAEIANAENWINAQQKVY